MYPLYCISFQCSSLITLNLNFREPFRFQTFTNEENMKEFRLSSVLQVVYKFFEVTMRLFIFCMRMKGFGASECCSTTTRISAIYKHFLSSKYSEYESSRWFQKPKDSETTKALPKTKETSQSTVWKMLALIQPHARLCDLN